MTNYSWTNPSVLAFAQHADPIDEIQARARTLVLNAAEQGWNGPPFDPFKLAELRKIRLTPSDDVFDARISTVGTEGFQIEFNPNKPRGRLRYSIAHEIAHTLFPDCADKIRNREIHQSSSDDEWQLELLCNIGAAEILMPTGVTGLEQESIAVENLLRLRKKYDVSTEAIFLRMVKLTNQTCAMFSAARLSEKETSTYRIDYCVPSRHWSHTIPRGVTTRESTVLAECTAVGYTAKGTERWNDDLPRHTIECVGIPPYPGHRFPRIVGLLLSPEETELQKSLFHHVYGSALEPRGGGPKIIAHIVNNKTANWGGGGFASSVRKHLQVVQEDFKEWAKSDPQNLILGNLHLTHVHDEIIFAQMVSQHGYGASKRPRIRYAALHKCLLQVADLARRTGASVHMPKIGTGHAGGNWYLIQGIIDETLIRNDVEVYIYELPNSITQENQGTLKLWQSK